MATATLEPKVKKVDTKGQVHVAWMKPGAQRATRVSVEGAVRQSGSWWAKVGRAGKKQGGFKTKKAAAEWIVEQVSPNSTTKKLPAKRKRGSSEYEFTVEDIVRERDERQQSWKLVATALGLKTPGGARKAYSDLTGRPHSTSALAGRTSRSKGGEMVTGADLTARWDGDTNRAVVEEALRCPECHGKGWVKTERGHKRCEAGVVVRRWLWVDDEGHCRSGPAPEGHYKVEEVLRVSGVHHWYPVNKANPVPSVSMTNVMTGGGHVWPLTDFVN